jgi:hypothetical protein
MSGKMSQKIPHFATEKEHQWKNDVIRYLILPLNKNLMVSAMTFLKAYTFDHKIRSRLHSFRFIC